MTARRQPIVLEAAGDGRPVVLVHGWGQGRHAFDPVVDGLAARRRVLRPDLPGAGASRPDVCGADLDAIADALCAEMQAPAVWVGWSLGGLVALAAAARQPAAVEAVVLLAASPRFTATPDWPGIDPGTLAGFARAVDADPVGARDRFLAFQLEGSEHRRRALRALRASATRDGCPEPGTLRAGLELLAHRDLRATLAALPCPVRAVLGAADPLVPTALAPSLRARGVPATVLPGAGHAPFASHPDAVIATLLEATA